MRLINDGKLAFSLYHSTSSIFLDSIRKNGFGGINIIQEYNVLESFRKLVDYAKNNILGHGDILIYNKILKQSNNNGFDFTHGLGHLTLSRKSALNYSYGNKWGSEAINLTLGLFHKLYEKGYVVEDLLSSELNRIRLTNCYPIMLEFSELETDYLQNEDIESANKILKKFSEEFEEVALESTNYFKIARPIPIEKSYMIKFEDSYNRIHPKAELTKL